MLFKTLSMWVLFYFHQYGIFGLPVFFTETPYQQFGPDNEAMEGLYDMESLYNAEHPFINFLKEYYSIDDKWPYVSRNDAIPETRKHKYNAYLLSGYEKYNDVRRSDTLIERKRNTDADRQKERTDCLTRYNNPVLINACLSNIQRSN